MSAFVSILDRSGHDLDRDEIRHLAEPLAVYGDVVSSFCCGPLAVAIRSPGDPSAGEQHGPLTGPGDGRVVALAGRFNRVEDRKSGAGGGGSPATAGPRFVLEALREDDFGFLADLEGSFALVVGDAGAVRLTVARDHLGDRKVYYWLDRRWLVAASEPAPILRHAAVSADLDERTAVRFLAFRFTHSDRSFFRSIRELAPGHRLEVTASEARVERYWRLRPRLVAAQLGRRRAGAELVRLLRHSVADQVADLGPERVALSLSGGLDSTALAALAPAGVAAFSWTFDDLSECDERDRVTRVAEHLKLRVRWVRGDELYPLGRDFVARYVHESSPYVNAFAALKDALYRAARSEGRRRMLVGDGGDALWAAKEYWLRDALLRRASGAVGALAATLRRAAAGDVFARLALRRLSPVAGLGSALRAPRLPWLTADARRLLPGPAFSPILPAGRPRHRHELVAGAKYSELESEEWRLFAQCGIDRGNPFWSWPLVELVLALPASWYQDVERGKLLMRQAMKGLLPEDVLGGPSGGSLGALFLRGIEGARLELRETVFRHPRSDWQRWVDREWLEPYLDATATIQFGHTILWRVICYELWQRRLIRSTGG